MKKVIFDFPEKDSIFDDLSKFINSSIVLLLGISGGPDSMFMFHLINEFFDYKNFDKKNIKIANFNHKFRIESDKESEFLKNYFSDYDGFYGELDKGNQKMNELLFRDKRHAFFSEKINLLGGPVYLCLGHNLDDRIETSFLNMSRGCNIEGFLNMSFFDKTNNTKILRPLLSLQKAYIQLLCDKYEIPYFIDHTNLDISASKRNYLRNNIIHSIVEISNKDKSGNSKFYESFLNIFNSLQEFYTKNYIPLVSVKYSVYWNCDFAYRFNGSFNFLSDVTNLFRSLGIYKNIYQTTLEEFFNFFANCISGYKYFNGVYFFQSHGFLYIIKAPKDFYKKTIVDFLDINNLGKYSFGDFEVKIDDEKLIGGKIRFPKQGDSYRKKTLNKYFINQKIPLFWRSFIPVIENHGEIISIIENGQLKI